MKTSATGLLVLLSVLVAESSIAQQGINAPPDTIFYNGKIITVDSGFTIQQAFAVRGDLYVAVGTNAAIQALMGENTRLVDLRGFAIIPGLSDNHDHLYNSEKVMRGIDLVGATSTADVLRRLRDGLAKAKAGETVFGSVGWRAPLTKNDLDQISTDVPIVALRGRRGAAVMNSAALKKAGIAKEMQSFMGREIPKDSSGELTGELPDFPAGLYAIDKVVPLPTSDEEDQMIAAGQKQRNALGITSTRDLSNWPPGMRAFVRMWRQGRLTVRISMGLELPDARDPAGLVRAQGVTPGFGVTGCALIRPASSQTPLEETPRRKNTRRLCWSSTAWVGGMRRTSRPTKPSKRFCRPTKQPTARARSATSDGWSSTFPMLLRR